MSTDADEQIQQRLDDEYEEYIQFVFGDIDSNDEKGWFEI